MYSRIIYIHTNLAQCHAYVVISNGPTTTTADLRSRLCRTQAVGRWCPLSISSRTRNRGERWALEDSLHSSNMAAWNIHLILLGDSWLLLKWGGDFLMVACLCVEGVSRYVKKVDSNLLQGTHLLISIVTWSCLIRFYGISNLSALTFWWCQNSPGCLASSSIPAKGTVVFPRANAPLKSHRILSALTYGRPKSFICSFQNGFVPVVWPLVPTKRSRFKRLKSF